VLARRLGLSRGRAGRPLPPAAIVLLNWAGRCAAHPRSRSPSGECVEPRLAVRRSAWSTARPNAEFSVPPAASSKGNLKLHRTAASSSKLRQDRETATTPPLLAGVPRKWTDQQAGFTHGPKARTRIQIRLCRDRNKGAKIFSAARPHRTPNWTLPTRLAILHDARLTMPC
jgi:hypothetical protein